MHAFGVYVAPEEILTYGISTMNDSDIRFAHEKERRIKLVAHVEKVDDSKLIMCVLPQLISRNKYIYSVEDEFNGVVIKGLFYDKQFMFGRGAGGHPTGSAVLSDITACGYNYRYEYKKRNDSVLPCYSTDHAFRIYFRYKTAEERNLLKFENIREQYTSEEFSYIIGDVSIANLKAHQEELRTPNCFVAAYPLD